MRQLAFLFATLLLLAGGSRLLADGKDPNFADDIVPIVKQHCAGCHGGEKQKGDLNLATYAEMKKGGSSGAVVVPGNPDKSRLFTLTDHREEPKMPSQSQKIPAAQIATIKLWIEKGAKENAGSKVSIPAAPRTDIGLKSVVKGRPAGAPPMPVFGKLKLDPVLVARRPGAVLALATSPWAPLAAVGGQKQVVLYNTDSGALIGVLPFAHGQINSIKFSRNAKFVLVAGGKGGQSGAAVLFNVETGEKVLEVGKSETDAILAADISADQTQIAVGGSGKLVRVYSTTDGSLLREIKKHTDWVTAVEYSPDGVLLATGDRGGGLFVWEAFTGREFFSLRGHTAMISDVSWRDDSNVLASSSEDTTIKLWEMENGGNIKNWGAHAGGAASVKFTHDGKLASTGRDRVTKLWDQNGAAQKSFEAFPDLGLRVAVTHENAKVIAGDWSGQVKVWAVADGKLFAALDA
ncbi:MAG TPA: c-type cytochrome domain-containing protein, partial [Planctomycetia bacterium]|nr:c-type cytochrome domain-containing protein [Planctomycetia bacterium]